jgi:D-alanyl-D-alanine carboxypeptidase/D-alanyl-D-alanine-endopeptidase (penicillin-binding protein 4)
MDLGPKAETPPPVAAVETDPVEALVLGKLPDGDLENLVRLVESQEVDYNFGVIQGLRRALAVCAAAAVLLSAPLSARSRPARSPLTLQESIERLARRPPARPSGVSIAIADLSTGEMVFQRNPDAPETIASVTKMISSAAALHYLGSDYRFRTTFWRRGEIQQGNLVGSLLVVGGGDPNISGRFYDDDSFAIFDKWAEGLVRAGITRVTGDLVLNASKFDGIYRHPDWPPERDTRWYQAPISALSYNDNVVIVSVGRNGSRGAPLDLSIDPETDIVKAMPRARAVGRTGSVRIALLREPGSDLISVKGTVPRRHFRWSRPLAIDDPPKFFGAALRSRLQAAGIEIVGGVVERDVEPSDDWTLVATTESQLVPTLAVSNKRSQSFYAEQVFKTLAYEKTGRGTWEGALALAKQFLATLGLDAGRFELRDGSGLSAFNRVSAGELVQFLEAMDRDPLGAVWRSTLAVAGEPDGSLRHRLQDVRGQVEAKTGTLQGVSTLAGYAHANSGKTYVFAILLNGPGVSEARGHAFQDRIVRVLVNRG